jgi:hypothetical protein
MKFKITSVITKILYNNTEYKTISSSDHIYPGSEIIITPTGGLNSSYSGKCYLGTITIKNITVPIQKGYIFDIQTVVNYTNVTVDTLAITFNVSSFTRLATNCTITGDINPITTIPAISVTSIDTL